jgi:hypothetical protein
VYRYLYYMLTYISLGIYIKSGITELYKSSIFRFLRSHHNDFHSGCINLHSHQQCIRVPSFLHSYKHMFLVCFFDDRHSFGLKWDGISMSFWLAFPLLLTFSHAFISHLYFCWELSNSFAHLLTKLFGFMTSLILLSTRYH